MSKIPPPRKSTKSKSAAKPIRVDLAKAMPAYWMIPGSCAMRVDFAAIKAAIIR